MCSVGLLFLGFKHETKDQLFYWSYEFLYTFYSDLLGSSWIDQFDLLGNRFEKPFTKLELLRNINSSCILQSIQNLFWLLLH